MMKFEQLKEQPDEITLIAVSAVLMPNGELISNGKTIGWFDDFKDKSVYKIIEE